MTINLTEWSPEFPGRPVGSRSFASGNILPMASPEGSPSGGIGSRLIFTGFAGRSHLLVPESDKFVFSILESHDHTLFGRMIWRTLGLVNLCQSFALHDPFNSLGYAGHAFTVIWP